MPLSYSELYVPSHQLEDFQTSYFPTFLVFEMLLTQETASEPLCWAKQKTQVLTEHTEARLPQLNLKHSSSKNTLFPGHWWVWISPPEHMLLCLRDRWHRTCLPGNCVTCPLHHDSDYRMKNQFQHFMSLQVGQLMCLLTLSHPTPTFLNSSLKAAGFLHSAGSYSRIYITHG